MVHLREMPEHLREALVNQALPEYGDTPWVDPKPLAECRVALISTAGLHRREDPPFTPGAGDYRIIPDDYDMGELTMSHLSTNFDRTGFYQDVNVSFPIERLHELAEDGTIGSVGSRHYSFMGHIDGHHIATLIGKSARQVVEKFLQDEVDVVLLTPA